MTCRRERGRDVNGMQVGGERRDGVQLETLTQQEVFFFLCAHSNNCYISHLLNMLTYAMGHH